MSTVEDVRHRVQLALDGGPACPACGHQEWKPMTARALAHKAGIRPGVVRRFAKGGNVLSNHLAALDAATLTVSEPWPALE